MDLRFFEKNKVNCPCREWHSSTEYNAKAGDGSWCCHAKTDWYTAEECEFEECPLIFFFGLLEKWEKDKILFKKF